MILVDTAIWVAFLNRGEAALAALLADGRVLMHPFVLGELAMGRLRQRERILRDLGRLPKAPVARDDEVLLLIERNALFGRGLGYVDAHLLASVRLDAAARLWTRDKRLHALAERLGIAARPD